MNAHDKRTLKERLQWIADWSEPDIDLADAGTAREALERINALEAELASAYTAGMERAAEIAWQWTNDTALTAAIRAEKDKP